MKFSEVIAALKEGKKVRIVGDGCYYRELGAPADGVKRQVVKVYRDGSWSLGALTYDGLERSDWELVEP